MRLTDDQRARAAAILTDASDSFARLVELSGMDKTTALRQADLRRVDFGEDDLSGFDFTGADLRGADASRARNKHAATWRDVRTDATTKGVPGPADAPPEDFDLERVHALILEGKAPPTSWWPFITELSFSKNPLARYTVMDQDRRARFNALQHLDLDLTKLADLTPIAGLNALQ